VVSFWSSQLVPRAPSLIRPLDPSFRLSTSGRPRRRSPLSGPSLTPTEHLETFQVSELGHLATGPADERRSFIQDSGSSSSCSDYVADSEGTSTRTSVLSRSTSAASCPQMRSDNSWFIKIPYHDTPKFTRLSLASSDVVLPHSAKQIRRRVSTCVQIPTRQPTSTLAAINEIGPTVSTKRRPSWLGVFVFVFTEKEGRDRRPWGQRKRAPKTL